MGDSPRAQALRAARTRALARLRRVFNREYQQFVDEELEAMGHEPRATIHDYKPRSEWAKERKERKPKR